MMDETTEEIKVECQSDGNADAYYHDPLYTGPISGEETGIKLEPGDILESAVGINFVRIDAEENDSNLEPEISRKSDDDASYVNGWIKPEEIDISDVEYDNGSGTEVFDTTHKEMLSTQKVHQNNIEEHIEEESFCCASCQALFFNIKTFTSHIKSSCFKHLYPLKNVSASLPAATARPEKNQGIVCKQGIPRASRLRSQGASRSSSKNIESPQHKQKSVSIVRGKRFTCDICNKSFARKHYRDRHTEVHIAEKNRKSEVDGKELRRRKDLRKQLHLRTGVKEFECAKCEKRFAKLDNLKKHLGKHTSDKNFACDICGKTFVRKGNRDIHMRVHGAEAKHECDTCAKGIPCSFALCQQKDGAKDFECGACGKSFARLSNLKQHVVVHTGEKNFACSICNKSFALKKDRGRHMLVHGGKRKHKCKVCGKRFRRPEDVRIHTLTHNGVKDFECAECKKRFATLAYLKKHRVMHTGDKNFACNFCSKSFAYNSQRNNHQILHTGVKNFSCTKCKKTFAHKSHRDRHMAVHGAKKHECDDCGKRFRRLDDLRIHTNVHTGAKDLECAECGTGFTSLATLKRHQLVHTGKKNFACAVCNKSFAQKGNRDSHMMVHGTGAR